MKLKLSIACLLFVCLAQAQEIIKRDLDFNPAIAAKAQTREAFKMNATALALGDTLELPFKDDFSYVYYSVYPADSLWIDNYVFINNTYPIAQPTMGVATFDGLNEVGYPYDFTAPSSSSNPADSLTSKPINLFRPASDSLIISFFYQARGRGNAPEAKDSLVLDFKKPNQKKWQRVWSQKGYVPSASDTAFKYVMINITDTAYLQKGFQFRFRNYATTSGGVDQWHVDYVVLDAFRSKLIANHQDVAFVYNPPSLIKRYQAMPWEQYQTSDMQTNSRLFIRNNYTATVNMDYLRDSVVNAAGGSEYFYDALSTNVDPFTTNGYLPDAAFAKPPQNFQFPVLTDSTRFKAYYYYQIFQADEIGQNNKIIHDQVFSNYYAYDDGIAEYAMQITGQTAQYAKIAYKFDLNKADTLRAINIYFMPFLTNTSLEGFQLRVWGDSLGYPGALLYSETTTLFPVYDKSKPNLFHTYKLQTPFKVTAGSIFIGYMQVTANGLNVGLDENNDSQSKLFVKFISSPASWTSPNFGGAAMIRPVFGKDISLVGIDEKAGIPKPSFTIYPNPAKDILYIDINNNTNTQISIVSIQGPEVISLTTNANRTTVNTDQLSNGIYFVKMTAGETIATSKLIISR